MKVPYGTKVCTKLNVLYQRRSIKKAFFKTILILLLLLPLNFSFFDNLQQLRPKGEDVISLLTGSHMWRRKQQKRLSTPRIKKH
jgi:hypothetical protein